MLHTSLSIAFALLLLCCSSVALATSPNIQEYNFGMYDAPYCLEHTGERANDYGFPIRNNCTDMTLSIRWKHGTHSGVRSFALGQVSEDDIFDYEGTAWETYIFEWTLKEELAGELVVVEEGVMTVEYYDVYNEYDIGYIDEEHNSALPQFLGGCSATNAAAPRDASLLGTLLLVMGGVGVRRKRR